MYVHDQEALKLSIVCMRTGFTQAHELLWVTCLILLVSLCFSVCLFVLRRWDLWGSAMPAFSCQYLDKDELLHLAGANKDHIYIILILHIYIVRPFRNAALFIFVQFSCWPRWSECFAWQVFSTQGVASRIRALPAVFGAFWAHISLKYPWSCSTADYSWLLMGLRLVLGITCPNFGLGCGLDAECWQVFVPVCNSLLHDWPDSKLVPSETMQYLDASTHGTHWMKCMLILRMQELDEIIEIYRNQAITLNHLEEGLLRNHLGPDLKVRLWKTVRASNVRCWMPLTRCNCIEHAFQLKLRSGM